MACRRLTGSTWELELNSNAPRPIPHSLAYHIVQVLIKSDRNFSSATTRRDAAGVLHIVRSSAFSFCLILHSVRQQQSSLFSRLLSFNNWTNSCLNANDTRNRNRYRKPVPENLYQFSAGVSCESVSIFFPVPKSGTE